MSLADLLRRAADLVEHRAVEATTKHGNWWASATSADDKRNPENPVVAVTLPIAEKACSVLFEADWGTPADAAWIAMLGPQIAAPLAAWLRAEADLLDQLAELDGLDFVPPRPPALALARALLGGDT